LSQAGVEAGDEQAFRRVVSARRAVRHFRSDPIPVGVLEEILALTQRAPTGYNLQAWNAVVVTEPALRKALRAASFGQAQVEEAPATVVFATDSNFIESFERSAALCTSSGHWTHDYAAYLRKMV